VKLSAAPVVLLPARIQIGKGHRDLIKAAALLVANKIDLSLCFAGAVDSEVEHQELRRIVAAAGLQSRVSFLGETTAEELRDLYAASCMVVLPSHAEGLGRVLLEAQAMRKPVIAYDSGGMSQALLHNETGFLVKAEDVEALADKISILLGNEAERLRMGASGRGFVIRNFAIPALIQRHEAFYLKALSYARQE
jgi:glycosyltransferase involved in cell wall biosynthesis